VGGILNFIFDPLSQVVTSDIWEVTSSAETSWMNPAVWKCIGGKDPQASLGQELHIRTRALSPYTVNVFVRRQTPSLYSLLPGGWYMVWTSMYGHVTLPAQK